MGEVDNETCVKGFCKRVILIPCKNHKNPGQKSRSRPLVPAKFQSRANPGPGQKRVIPAPVPAKSWSRSVAGYYNDN